MKKKYSRFRELWAVPKYKVLFKLGGWFIFFAFIFIFSSLGNETPPKTENITGTTYSKMKTNIIEKSLSVKYNITSTKEYYLEGTLINNIISGTLEHNENITKIKIDNDNIYTIQKGKEEINDTLLNDINTLYLFPENIINIINNNASFLRQSEDNKIYTYSVDNKSYSVYINEEEIIKIIVLDDLITYELEFKTIN